MEDMGVYTVEGESIDEKFHEIKKLTFNLSVSCNYQSSLLFNSFISLIEYSIFYLSFIFSRATCARI